MVKSLGFNFNEGLIIGRHLTAHLLIALLVAVVKVKNVSCTDFEQVTHRQDRSFHKFSMPYDLSISLTHFSANFIIYLQKGTARSGHCRFWALQSLQLALDNSMTAGYSVSMFKFRILILSLALLMLPVSCAVISQPIRSEAAAPVPFPTLLAEVDRFKGRTVILGGYILETSNRESETVIKVLQVPLRLGEEPGLKDSSEGRFLIYHQGFLDPEVFSKNRVITVAGEVIGADFEETSADPIQYLKLKNREIYLWPEYGTYSYPYPPWPYPYFWHDYPYHRYRYWYWR